MQDVLLHFGDERRRALHLQGKRSYSICSGKRELLEEAGHRELQVRI